MQNCSRSSVLRGRCLNKRFLLVSCYRQIDGADLCVQSAPNMTSVALAVLNNTNMGGIDRRCLPRRLKKFADPSQPNSNNTQKAKACVLLEELPANRAPNVLPEPEPGPGPANKDCDGSQGQGQRSLTARSELAPKLQTQLNQNDIAYAHSRHKRE
ncbi:hypothetical protein RRG08_017351 [Elysia crispata]|uniref:Uncharacterized protein n=1 Tax=Elysia crispata TaxID=231223 RepID=A0AAE1E0L8_9GAST|nr:hypothetical protein RRG08_017351 [Elysia crispata]